LFKSEMFGNDVFENNTASKINYQGTLSRMMGSLFQRRLAYALAVFLFTVVGVFGVAKYHMSTNNVSVKVSEQSTADFKAIRNSVESFKMKSQALAQVSKTKSQDFSSAVREVKDAAKELTDAIQKDPQLAKVVALDVNNNKTYLDVPGGGDLKESSDALYKVIVDPLIEDLKERSLTKNQESALSVVEEKDNKGDYIGALQDALLLINSTDDKIY